jgi:hypothetical protein
LIDAIPRSIASSWSGVRTTGRVRSRITTVNAFPWDTAASPTTSSFHDFPRAKFMSCRIRQAWLQTSHVPWSCRPPSARGNGVSARATSTTGLQRLTSRELGVHTQHSVRPWHSSRQPTTPSSSAKSHETTDSGWPTSDIAFDSLCPLRRVLDAARHMSRTPTLAITATVRRDMAPAANHQARPHRHHRGRSMSTAPDRLAQPFPRVVYTRMSASFSWPSTLP